MAFASIIGSAIGIILLIVTAYVLVGGVLTTTQVAMNAQSDMTAVHMQMLGTSISIDSVSVENSSPNIIYLNMRNSGSEPIDLTEINVFLKVPESAPVLIPKGSDAGKWSISPDVIQWRPTEVLNMSVNYAGGYPVIVQLTTGNGVSAITKANAP
jgi:archaeal flagellar protein FlaF